MTDLSTETAGWVTDAPEGRIATMLYWIRRSVEITVVALFAALTVAVFLQVVARYVFNRPPAWTEELARYCQVWLVLLSSSLCIRKGSHLAVDYLGPALKSSARKALDVVTGVLITVYAAVVSIWGIRLMVVGFYQVSPAMQVNMGVVYAVFPLAGGLMVIESLLVTLRRLRGGHEA
jgi:TRAP-type C4-dicarboxylate transport system permease small subunit